jgi:hypothetical protein
MRRGAVIDANVSNGMSMALKLADNSKKRLRRPKTRGERGPNEAGCLGWLRLTRLLA